MENSTYILIAMFFVVSYFAVYGLLVSKNKKVEVLKNEKK